MEQCILEMRAITKRFSGVVALQDVNFRLKPNQIHALVGENGAGKSTLMNILSGVYPFGDYEGDIVVDNETCTFRDIKDSGKKGIAIIHQELALIPDLSVAENIFLGNEQANKGIVNWDKTRKKAVEIMEMIGLSVSPEARVRDLGLGKQQLIEIAKALTKDVRVLILDEPTAALNDEDSRHLLDLLVNLKERGISSILISHKLNEIVGVAQEITVLRDGKTIETLSIDDATEDKIIKLMVGRELTDRYPPRNSDIGEVCFEITDWNVYAPEDRDIKVISEVNLFSRRGEIVGISGLMGAGRTELALSIFGRSFGSKVTGQLSVDGKEVVIHNVSDAIKHGIAYVTEDRKNAGLILIDPIKKNMSLAALDKISNKSVLNENEENKMAEEYRSKLNIRSSSILQNAGNLSGGNQQKVMFSKWIFTDPEVLILDEPTRGVDVGAKYEIYAIINDLAERGKSVIMISSELPELLGMCDRIYVLNEGEIAGEVAARDASQERIMQFIMQHNKTRGVE